MLVVHREREHSGLGFEDERRAVAVMHVEIDDGDALDAAGLEHARRHGDVVEGTEPFTMIRKRVVKTPADVSNNIERRARRGFDSLRALRALRLIVVLQAACDQRGPDRASDHQSKPFDHRRRPREFELSDVFGRHRAVAHLGEVFAGMYERELLPRGRLWLYDSGWPRSVPDKVVGDPRVLFSGKNVQPDIDVIPGCVDNRQLPGAATI
jgi:hypothetical protein